MKLPMNFKIGYLSVNIMIDKEYVKVGCALRFSIFFEEGSNRADEIEIT